MKVVKICNLVESKLLKGNSDSDWAQKYRPRCIDDVILPKKMHEQLKKLVLNNGGMSLLLHGTPGTGKTTVANLISPDNTYHINCATDNSVDMVRQLPQFCSAVSFNGSRKVVLFDEADSLSNKVQVALRGVVEKYSVTTDFVMTANEPKLLGDAIKSRFLPVHFDSLVTEEIKVRITQRLKYIVLNECDLEISSEDVQAIIDDSFPDMRSIIKRIQFEFEFGHEKRA